MLPILQQLKNIVGKPKWNDSPVDSLQGLSDKITDLSQYRGVFAGNANTISTNGWWRVQNGATNVPSPYGLIESKKIYLDADAAASYKYWEQTFTEFTVSSSTKYYRTSYDDRVTWTSWQKQPKADETVIKVNRTSVDLNTIFNTGTEGYAASCTNRPPGISDGFFKDYYSPYGNLGYQEYTEYSTGRKFKRRRYDPYWSSWSEIATTDKVDISLLNGWQPWGGIYTLKAIRSGNIVNITGVIGSGTITDGTPVFSVPLGFRPKQYVCVPIFSGDNKIMNLLVQTDGSSKIDNSFGNTWTTSLKIINFSYACE